MAVKRLATSHFLKLAGVTLDKLVLLIFEDGCVADKESLTKWLTDDIDFLTIALYSVYAVYS